MNGLPMYVLLFLCLMMLDSDDVYLLLLMLKRHIYLYYGIYDISGYFRILIYVEGIYRILKA